jgi:hypothetical protein
LQSQGPALVMMLDMMMLVIVRKWL